VATLFTTAPPSRDELGGDSVYCRQVASNARRLLLLALTIAGCATGPGLQGQPTRDAPLLLTEPDARQFAHEQLHTLISAPSDLALRTRLATAIVDDLRVAAALRHGPRQSRLLFELLGLWATDPGAAHVGLQGHVPALRQARAAAARLGDEQGALAALVALWAADEPQRAAYRAEIEQVLAYLDELDTAEGGPLEQGVSAIARLEPVVLALPLPWLVDLYVERLLARQGRAHRALSATGIGPDTFMRYHDVVDVSRQIASALARAGRPDELHARLASIDGIGGDDRLRAASAAAMHPPSAGAWLTLADEVRRGRSVHSPGDPSAALAICLWALTRHPDDLALMTAGAEHAQTAGHPRVALQLIARARMRGSDTPELRYQRARLLAAQVARLAEAQRLDQAIAAHQQLQAVAATLPAAAARALNEQAATALVDGLISAGRLAEAESWAVKLRAASQKRFLLQAELAHHRGQLELALTQLQRGIEAPADDEAARRQRARLHRLAGETADRLGEVEVAQRHLSAALLSWSQPRSEEREPPAAVGQRLLESARILSAAEEPSKAMDVMRAALSIDSDGAATYLQAAEFLLQRGEPAVEVFVRSLSSPGIAEAAKIYIALRVLAAAASSQAAADPRAMEFLRTRSGETWPDLLARAATHSLPAAELLRHARTSRQATEAAYYLATLGLVSPPRARQLLLQVVEGQQIRTFEYRDAAARLSGKAPWSWPSAP
jgi:hypothetical protein